MFRRLLAIVCLSVSLCAWVKAETAKIPRLVASVPIHTPDPKKNINLKTYHGKILMVILFITDCDDCLKMMTFASQLQNEFGPRGFQAVGAALDEKAPYLIGPFSQRYKLGFPIGYLNKQNEIMSLLGLPADTHTTAPIVMVLDHQSNVRFQYYGKDKALFGENNANLRLIVENLIRLRDEHKAPQQAKGAGE
jgi:AhpC/TSA family